MATVKTESLEHLEQIAIVKFLWKLRFVVDTHTKLRRRLLKIKLNINSEGLEGPNSLFLDA